MFFHGGWGYELNVVIGVYFVFTTTELRVEMILNYIKGAPGTLPVSLRFQVIAPKTPATRITFTKEYSDNTPEKSNNESER